MEAAACYYEYGNALFRAANRRLEDQADFEPCRDKVSEGNSSSAKGINKAMEDRAKKAPVSLKLAAEGKSGEEPSAHAENYMVTVENGEQIDWNAGARAQAGSVAAEEKEDDSDISLALEMMENAWSILDEHVNGNAADKAVTQNEKKSTDSRSSSYTSWAKEQLPRILIGIGDVLSFMNRHADAAAAYIRSIPFREEVIQNYKSKDTNENQSSQIPSLENLRHHRLLTETYALVAQELLACPSNENVITSEFREVLVSATERIDYSRGYYEKARDELQETGKIRQHHSPLSAYC